MHVDLSRSAMEKINLARHVEPQQPTLDLVFASDWKYLRYTAVTLASILKNYRGVQPIRVFILIDKAMRDGDVHKFDALKQIHSFDLHQIPVDASSFEKIRTSAGISVATYYRLVMHNLLPADAKKVLYLDSDLIIQESIDELYNIPFDGALFAGVEDSISLTYNRKFGIPHTGKHINAGVLLVNVDLMRNIDFDHLIERYLDANRYRIVLGDQQIITELFFNSIKYVPVKWNVHGSMFKDGWVEGYVGVQNNMVKAEAIAAIKDPAIIHYTLRRKPWISMEHAKSEIWYEYLSLTPYSEDIQKPIFVQEEPPTGRLEPKVTKQKKKKGGALRLLRVVLPGWALSVVRLRQTRLGVMDLNKRIGKLEKGGASRDAGVHGIRSIPQGNRGAKDDLDIKLKQIITSISTRTPTTFKATDVIARHGEDARVLSNVHVGDIEGGYNENLKTALRTADIRYNTERLPNAVVLVTQRLKQGMFWQCIETAYLYDIPLYFVEVALFGSFASYFDQEATLNEKRAFGFMIDDMGYYYDARQPSRLERTLNDPSFSLSNAERARSKNLIGKIIANNITKYNKYAGSSSNSFEIEDGAILVIGQKGGDASIHFAGANNRTFDDMLEAAVAESGGKTVYYKKHPDTILGALDIDARFGDGVVVLPDDANIDSIIDRCGTIYTVSSQVGFEGLLRGKRVITFGMPFYAGWGLTEDRFPPPRRACKRTVEELFHVSCIQLSVYVNGMTGKHIELEEAIDMVLEMRKECASRALHAVKPQ